MSLASYPLVIPGLVFIYKKTDWFKKIDFAIDRLLGIDKDSSGKSKSPKAEDEADKPAETKAPETETGVTRINIKIGDRYFCHLSSTGRLNRNYLVNWYCENEFVGKVDEDSVFHALKAGTTKVFCSGDGIMDDGMDCIYEISVHPRNSGWFADRIINCVISKAKKQDVLAELSARKLRRVSDDTLCYLYGKDETDRGLSVQFNASGELARAAFYVDKTLIETDAVSLSGELDDRMEKVELEGSNTRLWVHKRINDGMVEVDAYAFLAAYKNKYDVLCIGRSWRESGEELEFLQNINLATGLFAECVPDYNPEKLTAKIPAELVEPVNGPSVSSPRPENIEDDKPEFIPGNEDSPVVEDNPVSQEIDESADVDFILQQEKQESIPIEERSSEDNTHSEVVKDRPEDNPQDERIDNGYPVSCEPVSEEEQKENEERAYVEDYNREADFFDEDIDI